MRLCIVNKLSLYVLSTCSKCHRRPSSRVPLAILEFWLKGGLNDFGDKKGGGGGGGGDRKRWIILK